MKWRIFFEVERERVVGNMFLPAGVGPHPAVVVAGPMTSVKEQVVGVYASALAVHGIAALCIDHRHYGESAGEPRQYEHYEHKIADLQHALQWMANQRHVDRDRMGLVGVCLGCGYAAHTAARTPEVKAMGLVAGYYRDPNEIRRRDPEAFDAKLEQGRAARERFERFGETEFIPAAALEGDAAMTLEDTYDYYATERAGVPNYRNEFAVMSREHFLAFNVQAAADLVQVPVQMVHSEGALSPKWARRFYERLPESSRLDWIESTCQVDFYDKPDVVQSASAFVARHLNTVFSIPLHATHTHKP